MLELQGDSASVGVVERDAPVNFTKDDVIVTSSGENAGKIYISGQFVINAEGEPRSGCSFISSLTIEKWGTYSPTVSPSKSPTGWYLASGHPENITELQEHTATLAADVSSLRTIVSNLQSTVTQQAQTIADLTASVNPAVMSLQTNVNGLQASVSAVTSDVSTLRTAIANAVALVPNADRRASGSSSNLNVPSISAEGNNLMMNAVRGSITIDTATCGMFDPCDVIAALDLLREA